MFIQLCIRRLAAIRFLGRSVFSRFFVSHISNRQYFLSCNIKKRDCDFVSNYSSLHLYSTMPPKKKIVKSAVEDEQKEIPSDKAKEPSKRQTRAQKTAAAKPQADTHEADVQEDEEVPQKKVRKPPKKKAEKPAPAPAPKEKIARKMKATENVNGKSDDPEEKPKAPKGKTAKPTVDKVEAADSKAENAKAFKNQVTTDYTKLSFNCNKKNAIGQTYNTKISSWNVAGLRAWIKKDGLVYLTKENPDILCLQEIKCSDDKLPGEVKEISGYKGYWCSSKKDGIAGVGIFTKKEPLSIKYGIDDEEQDVEGRCITLEFEKFYVVNVYVPNSGRKLVTLDKRLKWNKSFKEFIKELDSKKPVILCGDMNVAHNEIDLANPRTNTKNAGFTKEEREGMTEFLGDGYVDTYRKLYPDKAQAYTFWSSMHNSRAKNIGWRLDYFIVSDRIMDNVCDSTIRTEVFGSDHCPLTIFLNI